MRKIDAVGNRVLLGRLDGDKLLSLAQLQIANHAQVGARAPLFANAGAMNGLYEGLCAAVKNRQIQVVELNDRIIDAASYQGRKQMLGSGDEHAFFHQAGGVTDSGHVSPQRFHFKTVEIHAAKLDTGTRWGRQDAQTYGCTAVKAGTAALHRRADCLFLFQLRYCQCLMTETTAEVHLSTVAKSPQLSVQCTTVSW